MKFPVTIFFIILYTLLLAKSNTEDVVYLKNGGIIRGQIIDRDPTGKIKVELPDRSVFAFESVEIDSVKDEPANKRRLREIRTSYYRKNHGFHSETELATAFSRYVYNRTKLGTGLSLQTINGYQFCPYFFMGAGMGIYRFITYRQTYSPFFMRFSSDFLKRKVTPYVYFDIGYAMLWDRQIQVEAVGVDAIYYKSTGGAYTAFGGGVRIYTHSRASIILSTGCKMNTITTNGVGPTAFETWSVKREYLNFVMNVGVSF